ncbi:hypothetical protein FGO68_gene16928 [Halteria grandinella]|uniref:Uncharacterized protein n=1 Tax=Halteria grandinella TaxID=5974 RepID=A0A8J8NZE4_HALGN|nr:hypothetical protein FGO68_gene16928 [Halteria grandinella]
MYYNESFQQSHQVSYSKCLSSNIGFNTESCIRNSSHCTYLMFEYLPRIIPLLFLRNNTYGCSFGPSDQEYSLLQDIYL